MRALTSGKELSAEILNRAILEKKHFGERSVLEVTDILWKLHSKEGKKHKARKGDLESCKTKRWWRKKEGRRREGGRRKGKNTQSLPHYNLFSKKEKMYYVDRRAIMNYKVYQCETPDLSTETQRQSAF